MENSIFQIVSVIRANYASRWTLMACSLLICFFLVPMGFGAEGQQSQGGYGSFPAYQNLRESEKACTAVPDSSRLSRESDSVIAILRGAGMPSLDDPIFILVEAGDDQYLTWAPNPEASCLLLFTSSIRANFHVAEILGRDKSLPVRALTANQLQKSLHQFKDAGIVNMTIDKCPHCEVQAVIPISESKSSEDLLKIWAVFASTRTAMGNGLLYQAREHFNRGDFQRAKAICADLIECIDVDRPEVHLLLGQCAARLKDSATLDQVREFLSLFEDEWASKLKYFEATSSK